MGLIMADRDLLVRAPEAPPLPPLEHDIGPGRRGWWWAIIVLVILVTAVTLGIVLTRGDTAPAVDVVPDQEVDTPFVLYEPGFFNADFFVGTDANLDPDAGWFQEEYLHDTPLMILSPDRPTFWIGGSGELDPER